MRTVVSDLGAIVNLNDISHFIKSKEEQTGRTIMRLVHGAGHFEHIVSGEVADSLWFYLRQQDINIPEKEVQVTWSGEVDAGYLIDRIKAMRKEGLLD